MLDRIHDELVHVHTLYAGALRKEQQEKEVFRAHCIRLKGERDLAREKLRRALGRKDDDDGTQFPPPPPDAPDSSTTNSAASSPDIRNSTPPLSASSESSSFPSSSAVTLDTEQDFYTARGSTASSPGHQQPEPIDSGSYPSPSPSCSSPPPPQSPILSRTARPLSQSASPEPEEVSATDDTNDLISAVFGDIGGARERKRVCLDEKGDVRSGKRRRTQEFGGPGDSATRISPSCMDCAEEPAFDTGNRRSSRCSDSESNGEAGENTINLIDDSSLPTPVSIGPGADSSAARRRNISFDLMYMLANDKVQCRICWYVWAFSFFLPVIISSHPHFVRQVQAHARCDTDTQILLAVCYMG